MSNMKNNILKKIKSSSKRVEAIHFETENDILKDFDLYSINDIKDEDLFIFKAHDFFPIVNRETRAVSILTPNKTLRKDLGRLADKTALKLLLRYKNSIYTTTYTIFTSMVGDKSMIDREYTDNEAKEFFTDLLSDADIKNASDIHITWLSEGVRIKYRIDGKIILQPKTISKELGSALRNIFVSKSGESEYQENEVAGKITELINGERKEYRVSVGKTVMGYVIVIRSESVMTNSSTLEKWGYSPGAIKLIRRVFQAHHGIVLVTGETGSGKTTLLYTCIIEKLNENPKYAPEILTVEDPVEIEVEGANQVQVNTKGNEVNWITFSKAIKMFLRQDPDMIVVGEIRDFDVAMNAITAAKTGHLTASTLHTNDVKSTFSRLGELGIDKSNIEDGVKAIISQKLINKLCHHCKLEVKRGDQTFFDRNPSGCAACAASSVRGCLGRVPVIEAAELSGEIDCHLPENFLSYYSLEDNLLYLLDEGIIDLEEVRRYIDYNGEESLQARKNISDIWHKSVSHNGNESLIFPIYQPVIDSKDFVVGYESYMRITDTTGDILLPSQFMPLIKKMNMYNKFSMFVLKQIIRDAKHSNKIFFWNIDSDDINDQNFKENLLELLTKEDLKDRIIIEFEFKKEFRSFIEFCNDNKIKLSFHNFSGNIEDIIFIERFNLRSDFIKTNQIFTDGVREEEDWIMDYLSIISHTDSEIVVNYIETRAILNEVAKKFKGKIQGFQGFGVGRPKKFEEI